LRTPIFSILVPLISRVDIFNYHENLPPFAFNIGIIYAIFHVIQLIN